VEVQDEGPLQRPRGHLLQQVSLVR
jgi:hypothetical protein